MKKNLFLTSVLFAIFSFALNAQTPFDFESLEIPSAGYWNGSDASGEFGNNELTFPNNYNSDYESWTGFSFAYDTITSDAQYAAHAESVNGHVFGIGFIPSDWQSGTYDNIPVTCKFTSAVIVQSVDITNNEKTAEVIINGDTNWGEPAFSDGDWFKIIIEGFYNGESKGRVSFFLADYTAGNSYVTDTWNTVNLSSFGITDSLQFNLASTHTGNYGMNTPAYFCFDNLTYSYPAGISENYLNSISIYPNPATDVVTVTNILKANITVYDISGKSILSKNNCKETEIIDLNRIDSGIYFIKIQSGSEITTKKIIKQ